MNQHEAAAAQIAGLRIGDREREADRDGGIDRIAALLQHRDADPRRARLWLATMPLRARTGAPAGACAGAATGASAMSADSEARDESSRAVDQAGAATV